MLSQRGMEALAAALGPRVLRDEPMSHFTAMRVGGPADLLLVCETTADVIGAANLALRHEVPWLVLGGGCNVLVADEGLREFVIINRAGGIQFDSGCALRAEAGAAIATVARGAVERGLAGLEWAAGLPGTVGGAIVGNAGAFDGDVAGTIGSALVLLPDGSAAEMQADWFEFGYRTSCIKRASEAGSVVLSAAFRVQPGDPNLLAARLAEILEWRRTRHPSGATMGSTFKNPPSSHAGYLIEQAGLRGHRLGGARISELHGNFFMNTGSASAADVVALIDHARSEVMRQFGVGLELEIELLGW